MDPDKLKEARKAMGMTQREMAEAIGSRVSTYAHWEQGIHKVSGTAEKLIQQMLDQKNK